MHPVRFAIEMVKIGVQKGHDFNLADPIWPNEIHLKCANPGCTTHWTKLVPCTSENLEFFRDLDQKCPQ
jgi:hypothetical protein